MTSNEQPTVQAVVVYESMYGNTRRIAEAVAAGIGRTRSVRTVAVADVGTIDLEGLGLLVVGAPTHAWGLSRAATRRAAVAQAANVKKGGPLHVERGASGNGVREWLARTSGFAVRFAAFDTRMDAPFGLSGSAARRIDHAMRRRGATAVSPPRGFFVTKQNTLQPHELEHAEEWGEFLATTMASAHDGGSRRHSAQQA